MLANLLQTKLQQHKSVQKHRKFEWGLVLTISARKEAGVDAAQGAHEGEAAGLRVPQQVLLHPINRLHVI